jgi:capsid protein
MTNSNQISLSGFDQAFDNFIGIFSPKRKYNRLAYRFAYDILDKNRLRKKRTYGPRGGDQDLNEHTLDELRQIARDLSTNNPLIKGLFRKLATNIVGTSTRIQARTDDAGWNAAAEQAVKEEMVENACDVTGRFNFHGLVKKCYYRYGIDGDIFIVITADGPQVFQGECCGTPYGKVAVESPDFYDIINGIAYSRQTSRILGYYIGKANKWGYIQPDSYRKYPAEIVHHMVNPERFDHSRGEPMLTSAVNIIDQLFGYIDAELVAAKINACFPLKVKTQTGSGMTGNLGTSVSTQGTNAEDDYNRTIVRLEPGQIWEGEIGDDLDVLGAARPPAAFDPFVMRMFMLIGNPLCLPLMLTTGDFSHATFMNARFAYN